MNANRLIAPQILTLTLCTAIGLIGSINGGRYVAVGASETLPFGVTPSEGYASMVASKCRRRAVIEAAMGSAPLLKAQIPPLRPTDLASLFVGPADILMSRMHLSGKRLHDVVREMSFAGRSVIVLAPPLRTIPAFSDASPELRRAQEVLYARIARETKPFRNMFVIEMGAGAPGDYLADGLHPGIEGQHSISEAIEAIF